MRVDVRNKQNNLNIIVSIVGILRDRNFLSTNDECRLHRRFASQTGSRPCIGSKTYKSFEWTLDILTE